MWEVRSDGTGLHQLLPEWNGGPGEFAGVWTPDGRYFIFSTNNSGRADFWALPEHKSLFGRAPSPQRLTNGPISYDTGRPSRDGKKIFAVGSKVRGEMLRYDEGTKQVVPYLSGISAIESTASKDGKWIAYVSYPDHTLWKSLPDGSGREQLTFPPMMVFYPDISPDGTKIAFSGLNETGLGLYVMDVKSRTSEKLAEFGHAPTWSPDGTSLAFGALVPGQHMWDEGPWCEIHTIDLRTRKTTALPDAADSRYAPWWPSLDRLIAFGVKDGGVLRSYDFQSGKWSSLGGPMHLMNWTHSMDRSSLYQIVGGSRGLRVQRIRGSDLKTETIVSVAGMRLVQDSSLGLANSGHWIGLAADGSIVLTRDIGSSEIYALDIKWP